MAKYLDQAGLATLWAKIKAFVPEGAVSDTELVGILTNYVTTNVLDEKVSALESQISAEVSKVFTFKGSVATYAELPSTDQAVGDVYNIEQADAEHGILAGDNVVWTSDSWDKLAGTIDLSAYVTKAYADDTYVPTQLAGTNGTAVIQNEATGGGAKFWHDDGTESFVGVNNGGATGMVAQIYADKQVDGNWIGSRLNVYQKGMFYHNAEDKADTEHYIADDPAHEIATLGDVEEASKVAEENKGIINTMPDQFLTDIVNVTRTDTTNTAEIRIFTKQPDGTYSPDTQHGVLTLVGAGTIPGAGTGAGLMTVADKEKLDGINALTEEEILAILNN